MDKEHRHIAEIAIEASQLISVLFYRHLGLQQDRYRFMPVLPQ